MAEKITVSFWNYNDFENYKSEWVYDWAELGINTPVAPRFNWKSDDRKAYREMLDLIASLGMDVILQFNETYVDNYDNGADEYRALITEIHDEFASHPAVVGIYVGEEPSRESNRAYHEGVRLIKEISPEWTVYINLGSIERSERMLVEDGQSLEDWICNFADTTDSRVMGCGQYSQLCYDGLGIFEYFETLRRFVAASKKCGTDVWATLLSSAHMCFRTPTEDDFRWQLNTAVACGAKAVVWFRLYDKLIAGDYHGSPIDEFGKKTTHYDDLARVQKRFNVHHAEIFARLHHVDTYSVGTGYGGYFYFVPGVCEFVDSATSRSAILSTFKDDEGHDYIVVLNTLQREDAPITLAFTDKVKKASLVYHNGKVMNSCFERGDRTGPALAQEIWLAPGQMELIRIN